MPSPCSVNVATLVPNGNLRLATCGLVDRPSSPRELRELLHRQGLFIHEMTHVWQAQTRGRFYLPLMRHPFCRYGYDLVPGRAFDWYGLEQQAEIVRHRFIADRGGRPKVCPPRGLLPFA